MHNTSPNAPSNVNAIWRERSLSLYKGARGSKYTNNRGAMEGE